MSMSEQIERRREIAREALEVGMNDPYWLCNLRGQVNTEDMYGMADKLIDDAVTLSKAALKIDSEELLPEEAALYIAERVNHGDYETSDHLYDALPISIIEGKNND